MANTHAPVSRPKWVDVGISQIRLAFAFTSHDGHGRPRALAAASLDAWATMSPFNVQHPRFELVAAAHTRQNCLSVLS